MLFPHTVSLQEGGGTINVIYSCPCHLKLQQPGLERGRIRTKNNNNSETFVLQSQVLSSKGSAGWSASFLPEKFSLLCLWLPSLLIKAWTVLMVHSLFWQRSIACGLQLGAVWLWSAGPGALPPQLLHHLQQGGALHLQGQRSLLQLTLAGKKFLYRGFKALDPSICHLENGRGDECTCLWLHKQGLLWMPPPSLRDFGAGTSLLMISSGHRTISASRADLLDPDILLHLLPWCSPSRDQGLRKQYQNIRGTWTPIYPERRGELKYTPGAAMGQTGSTQHRLFQLTIYLHYNFKLTNGQMASMWRPTCVRHSSLTRNLVFLFFVY